MIVGRWGEAGRGISLFVCDSGLTGFSREVEFNGAQNWRKSLTANKTVVKSLPAKYSHCETTVRPVRTLRANAFSNPRMMRTIG
jgi:hypothetical protein